MAASTNTPLELGDEFPATDRDQWLAAVRGVLLKGRPDATDDDFASAFARTLVTHTEDGFDVGPLYTAADAPPERAAPGSFPFTRSTHAEPRPWEIRQRVWVDVDESSAVTELESGATGVLVELGDTVDVDVLDRSLDGVLLDLAPISPSTPAADDGCAAANALLELWERRAIDPPARIGTLGVDPIGAWARSGGTTDLAEGHATAADVVARSADSAPSARALVADATVWHDAGATSAHELAWVVGGAAETVRALVASGVDLDTAFGAIEFRLAATADQFATITKFRAARLLWARVADVSGASAVAARMFQHADTSRAMLTRYDPWVNALRSTVACFSAAVGGADAVTVSPHDVLIAHGGSPLGRRIARNTQTILQLESNLARVVDLAGGSWYVEHRTDELAAAAWTELQRVEAVGGLVAAVEEGHVHRTLEATNAARRHRIATRAEPLTGLSEFPDIAETPPPPATVTPPPTGTPFEPFTLMRDAAGFELQRGRADAVERSTGARPVVFLATLGGLAASTARATFAKNLFEAAGIRTVQGQPSEFDPAVTSVVCLCSSDAVYREQASDAAAELRRAGATKVFVAGRKLDLDGVDEEVGLGSDVLDVLTRTLDDLGVPA